MAVVLTEDRVKLYEDLFDNPTIPAMLDLDYREFQGFVEYVFSCAGYAVEDVSEKKWPNGPGVDLNLYTDEIGGNLVARIEVRRLSPERNVDANDMRRLWGTLDIAGGVPGYLVTTTDFGAGARAVAAASAVGGRMRLVNGDHLKRYIAYVRGSRVREAGPRRPTTPKPTPPDCLYAADAIARRKATDTTVLTVGNNRGGVAKTTTALNVALALAERNWRVLLVDMDPQASLTSGLPAPEGEVEQGNLVDHFIRDVALAHLIRRTRFTNVSLLPAHPEMRMADLGGGGHPEQELAFVAALHSPDVISPDGEKFDWIVLDTPPGQSFFTRSALAASHHVLVPAALDTWAALGMNGLLETAHAMRGLMGTGVHVVGCLLTRYRPGPVKKDDMAKFKLDLDLNGVTLFNAMIRHDDRLETRNREATRGKLAGILDFAIQRGTGATDYKAAVEELMGYVHSS